MPKISFDPSSNYAFQENCRFGNILAFYYDKSNEFPNFNDKYAECAVHRSTILRIDSISNLHTKKSKAEYMKMWDNFTYLLIKMNERDKQTKNIFRAIHAHQRKERQKSEKKNSRIE